MSNLKSRYFQLKVHLKSFQATCHRSTCKASAAIKINEEERNFKDVVQMRKNVAQFNSELVWEMIAIPYDEVSGCYLEKTAFISIHYETIQIGGRLNKIKVGHVVLNLSKLLNTNSYRIQNYYPVEKCFDKDARLKLSVDFTQIQNTQNLIQMNQQRIKTSTAWHTSNIREKMVQDEKNILQQKVYEYQDRLEKYRDSHGQQMKKVQQQVEKKDQKIQQLSVQNNSLVSAMQSHKINIEKYKNRTQKLQKEIMELKELNRNLGNQKESIIRELNQANEEKKLLEEKLEQHEKTRENKQKYYKQEVQKYNNKYIQSQNTRNKIIFQLQTKLKTQLQKKDNYYQQIIKGLESKKVQNIHISKDTIKRKDREIVEINQKIQVIIKEKDQQRKQIEYLSNEIVIKQQKNDALLFQLETLKKNLSALSNENQQAYFSNETLEKKAEELQKSNSALKQELQQMKYQLQLAKGTLEENGNKIAKYTKQLQIHKERQYYLEERYQDELQMKTYNEQCIIQTNEQYRIKVNRLAVQCKLLKEMVEDMEDVIDQLEKDKRQLEDKLFKEQNLKFQDQQEIIVLQNEVTKYKKLLESAEEGNKDRQEQNIFSTYSWQSQATFQPQKYSFKNFQ